ncbi:hypothetical protein SK128_015586 [Halocaridina rubra]|uniref:Uncharacterized protein n=1 Tax=Halocaridina rubra TaxID=373956 RepID=A0AAN8WRT1_HALRR
MQVKVSFHQSAEKHNIFTTVWLMFSWFTAIAAIIILGGHTTHKHIQENNDNTFYWGRSELARSNRGLVKNLWIYNSNSDWSSDHRENAIIGLIYGIIGGNLSHQALETFHGNAYDADIKQAKLNIVKALHIGLGIEKDDFQKVFGITLEEDLPHTYPKNYTLTHWGETVDVLPDIIAKPVITFTKPAAAYTRPVESVLKPAVAITRPVELISKPLAAHTKPVEAVSQPAFAFTRPIEPFIKPIAASEAISKPHAALTETVKAMVTPAANEKRNIITKFLPTLKEIIRRLQNKNPGVAHTTNSDESEMHDMLHDDVVDTTALHSIQKHLNRNITETQLWTSIQKLLRNSTNGSILLSKVIHTLQNSTLIGGKEEIKTTYYTESSGSITKESQANDATYMNQDSSTIPAQITKKKMTAVDSDMNATGESTITQVTKSNISYIDTDINNNDNTVPIPLPTLPSRNESLNISDSSKEQGITWACFPQDIVTLIASIICWIPLLTERLFYAWNTEPTMPVIVPILFFLLAQLYNILRALCYTFDQKKVSIA